MGGALGFALGTALNAAGGFAQAKVQKERQHDDFLLSAYQAHPEMASTPDAQTFLKKKFGPDVAGMFMQAGQASQQFGQDLQGGSSSPAGGAQAPNAGGGTIAAGAPQGDPMQAHIAELDSSIQRYRGLQAKYANDPGKLQIISQALNEANQQRNQLTSEQYGAQKQQEGFAQQSKLESDRFAQQDKNTAATGERQDKAIAASGERQDKAIAASNERSDKAIAALGDRLAKSEAFQNDMQSRREQQQNHLQDLKDAKTAEDRSLKMKTIIASLGKTTADLTAKLGKGSDYSQAQREMSAESHNQYIDSLAMMTDDPAQAAALQKLKISVGAATPSKIPVFGSETAGAVGAGGGDVPLASKSGKKMVADPSSPSGYSYAD